MALDGHNVQNAHISGNRSRRIQKSTRVAQKLSSEQVKRETNETINLRDWSVTSVFD